MERAKGPFIRGQPWGPRYQDRGELFEKTVEVTASESEVVYSKGDEAFCGAELNRPCRSKPQTETLNPKLKTIAHIAKSYHMDALSQTRDIPRHIE